MGNKKFSKEFFQSLLNKSMKEKITIVVLIGILLLVITIPVKKKTTSSDTGSQSSVIQNTSSTDQQSYETYLQDKLESILTKVDGVGKVKVVVTLKSTGEKVIASDSTNSEEKVEETDSAGGARSSSKTDSTNTNIFYDTGNGNAPYVTMENMPEVEGIIIVAEGGGDGTIASNITSAVEALLNVPAHKIKVLKMS